MKKIWLLLLAVLLQNAHTTEIMLSSEIKEGMKGYGKTVFSGTNIDTFDVEIIGVLKNARPQSDIILARLKSDLLLKTGIVAGMSGSPVYISNRLIGAVAFSWTFSKEPITGITPIKDMLDVLQIKEKEPSKTGLFFSPDEKSINTSYKGKNYSLESIKTPLIITGCDERILRLLDMEIYKYNFLTMHGGVAGNITMNKKELNPGDAVGVQLVSGDMNITGIGTVTYREGDKILLFGHTMFYGGSIKMPLTTAYVLTVMPSLEASFKLATSGNIIGKIVEDRVAAVSAKIGEYTEMVPVTVSLSYPDGNKTYSYNIVDEIQLFPLFLSVCAINSAVMNLGMMDKSTVLFDFEILLDDGNKIKLKETFSDIVTDVNLLKGMQTLLSPLIQLAINKFKEVNIKSVKLNINITGDVRIAEIDEIKINKSEVKPGETIEVTVILKPYQAKSFEKKLKLEIPDDTEPGQMMLFVSSANSEQAMDVMQSPAKYQPKSYEQLLKLLNEQERSTDLVAWVQTKDKGLVLGGEEFPNLPSSIYFIIKNSQKTGAGPLATKIKQKYQTDYIIYGIKNLPVNIKDKRKE